MLNVSERLNNIPETTKFLLLEKEADVLFGEFNELGIWNRMEQIGRLKPSLRIATIATNAANRLNEIAVQSGINILVSPKATFLTGLLFKSGQAIDDSIVDAYDLNNLDPHLLNLYRFPAYAPERTIETSNVLKLALLLHKLGHPQFAELILHGPHPKFFEEAELPNILVSLANANFGQNTEGSWRSYFHPAVNLLAIEPYAQRSDELPSATAKDWIDRAHMTAINTTLQHTLRIHGGINFSDETQGFSENEIFERWTVFGEICKQLGVHMPTEIDYELQAKKLPLLRQWVLENNITERLKANQLKTGHLIYDHSKKVSDLMSHLAREINKLSQQNGGKPLLNEEYLGLIGLCHDCIKAFDEEEVKWLEEFEGYGNEFMHTYPAEVSARGTVTLAASHDAKLYAWLRHLEETRIPQSELGKSKSIARDFLSGPYHLFSFISVLLSYSDLAVTNHGKKIIYEPDITERFMDTTLKYVSDQHTAIISYAKLMTIAASLSWYLGLPLPKKGSSDISENSLEVLNTLPIVDEESATKGLWNIMRVLNIFGIAVPTELKQLISKNGI